MYSSGDECEEEGSSPANLQCLPFKCSMCSLACRELARIISRGESGWKEWYAKHPDLTMPVEYQATAPTAVPTEDQDGGDGTAPSGSHNSEDVRIHDIGPLRFEGSRIQLKRSHTRGAKKENA